MNGVNGKPKVFMISTAILGFMLPVITFTWFLSEIRKDVDFVTKMAIETRVEQEERRKKVYSIEWIVEQIRDHEQRLRRLENNR